MRTIGDRIRDIATVLNIILFLFAFIVLLPFGEFVWIIVIVLYVIVTARIITRTGDKHTKENRKLSSRIRYRIHHSLFEVKSYSTRKYLYYKGRHDLSSIIKLNKYKSYRRFEIVASINEVSFTYYEETLVPKISIRNYPSFKGFVVTLKSDISNEIKILENVQEFTNFFEGYVVLNIGQIKFYIKSEQYIHTIYENEEIKEQITKIHNDVSKIMRIKDSIEKILLEDYKY